MSKAKWLHGKRLELLTMITVLCALAGVCALMYFVFFKGSSYQGITKAEAAKLIAGACADDDQFAAMKHREEWYSGYTAFAVDNGYINEGSAQSDLTAADVRTFLQKLGASQEEAGLQLPDKDNERIRKSDFINAYIRLLRKMEYGSKIASVETTIVGTPSNVGNAAAWQAYTDDGMMYFEGLALDYALDRKAMLAVRGDEILCVINVTDETTLTNAWVISGNGTSLSVFVGGVKREYQVNKLSQNIESMMADIHLNGGKVKSIEVKTDTIGGRVLSADRTYIEIEGYGKVPLDDKYKIYRTYGGLALKDYGDLIVGYDLQNFIVADGKICGAVISKPLNADKVRVLIKTNDFARLYHNNVTFSSDTAFTISYGSKEEKSERHEAGEQVTVDESSAYLADGRVRITPDDGGRVTLYSISRAYGNPEYEGTMEVALADGGLVVINEVPIEQYLKRVVPSEMPVSFGVEALKVQAVCARSYVYKELDNNNYVSLGAHLDDSTQYQVYNNVAENAASNQAIAETDGVVLTYNGEPVQTYYYSTSCGVTTDVSLWGSNPDDYPYFKSRAVGNEPVEVDLTVEDNFKDFIKKTNYSDYDRRYDLYRWELNVTDKELSSSFNSKVNERRNAYPNNILVKNSDGVYEAKSFDGVGTIIGITVEKRVAGGAAVTVVVTGSDNTVRIEGENHIRYLFGVAGVPLITANGTFRNMSGLPSAFCIFEPYSNNGENGFKITGGGYGHGIGMSQNAVYTMVNGGMSYKDVLTFFYPGTEVSG